MSEVDFRKMLPLYGKWSIPGPGNTVMFSGGGDDGSHGLVLVDRSVDDGVIECKIQIPTPTHSAGAFVVFRANGQDRYYAAGLGGWEGAYTLLEGHHLSPTRLAAAGNISNLVAERIYGIQIILDGQRVQFSVDGVRVIDYDRLVTPTGTGIGLFSFRGTGQATFGPINIDDRCPNAFIAMPFSEPYNEVYTDALRPTIEAIGYEPVRVDELSHPGVILNDIWAQITEASAVIAEVTDANPNVYYEVGVAHALRKPTVLLAQRGTKLPFDLGPHRCIFYDNTIAGRAKLLDSLKNSLIALLGVPARGSARAA